MRLQLNETSVVAIPNLSLSLFPSFPFLILVASLLPAMSASRDSNTSSEWERFAFDKFAPLDNDSKQSYFGGSSEETLKNSCQFGPNFPQFAFFQTALEQEMTAAS